MASPDYSTIDDPYDSSMHRNRENGGLSSEDDQESVGTSSKSGGYGGMNATESGGSSATGGDPSDLPEGAVGGGQLNDIWVGTFLKSTGYKPGKRGFYLDGRTGFAEFTNVNVIGEITSSSIHIPDKDTTANSFHVDEDGNMWFGATETDFDADNDNANAYILNSGVAKFQNVTLESSVTIRDIQENSEVAMQNWTTDIVFSATDADTVSWSSGSVDLMAGDSFSINSGNTGDMGAKTYIYFQKGEADLQTSVSVADAVGQNKILICVAEPSSNQANFQVFGGEGGLMVDRNSIEQRTITANRIAANTITGNEISALNILGKTIKADTGEIGGWTLASNTLSSGNVEINSNTEQILFGSATDPTTGVGVFLGLDNGSYEFRAGDPSGDNIHWDGSSLGIDGFVSGTLTLGSGPSISIDGANTKIESSNYSVGPMGSGFSLTPDLLEVGNIAARGTIRTSVFEKDSISSVGGSLSVSESDKLATDMTSADSETLTIEGNITLAVGDIVRIKEGTDDEWIEITDASSAPTYGITRDKDGDYATDSNPAWSAGAAVVNYGQSGDAGIYMTASDSNAPYLEMFENTGSPWDGTSTIARLGNLNGLSGYSSEVYGMFVGESNKYFKYDQDNGVEIVGAGIDTALSGARVRILPDAQTGLLVEDDNSNKVFEALIGGADVGDVTIGDFSNNKGAKWDKSEQEFIVRGQVQATGGVRFGGNGTDGALDIKNGASMDFERSNSDYLSISDSAQTGLDITGDITLETWVNVESAPGAGVEYEIMAKGSAYILAYVDVSGTKKLRLSLNDGNGWETYDVNQDLGTGSWKWVAVRWNSSTSTAEFFVDASSVGTASGLFTSINDSSGSFTISSSAKPFDGKIDEVRVWSTHRTQKKIVGDRQDEIDANTTDLAGYWRLNNTTKGYANGNDLTKNNSPSFSTNIPSTLPNGETYIIDTDKPYNFTTIDIASNGILQVKEARGQSLELDRSNDEWVEISDSEQTGLDLSGDFTIEAWIRPTDDTNHGIVSKWNSDLAYRFYYDNFEDNRLVLDLSSDGSTTERVDATSLDISKNEWTHVVVTLDDSTNEAEFLVNGSSVGTATFSTVTSIHDSSAQFAIGGYSGSGTFTGQLDEVRVWSDKRTLTEIQDNYNKELNGDEANLEGYWTFKWNLFDQTSNENILVGQNRPGFSNLGPFGKIGNGGAIVNATGDVNIEGTIDCRGVVADEKKVRAFGVERLWGGTKISPKAKPLFIRGGNGGAGGSGYSYIGGDGAEGGDAYVSKTNENSTSQSLEVADLVNDEAPRISDNNQSGLDITSDVTIEAWVKPDTLSGFQTIVSKSDNTSNNEAGYMMMLTDDSSKKNITLVLSSDGSSNTYYHKPVSGLSIGSWQHVAVAWNAGSQTIEFYLNGNSQGTLSTSESSIYNNFEDFVVGAFSNEASEFDGNIAEVRVWSERRTDTEISDNYKKSHPTRAGITTNTNCVFYGRFDGDVSDNSVERNNLSSQSGTSFESDVPGDLIYEQGLGGVGGRSLSSSDGENGTRGTAGDGKTIAGGGGGGGGCAADNDDGTPGNDGQSGSPANGLNGGDGGDGGDIASGFNDTEGGGGGGAGGAGLYTGDGGNGGKGGDSYDGPVGEGGDGGDSGAFGGVGGDGGFSGDQQGTSASGNKAGDGGDGYDGGGRGGDSVTPLNIGGRGGDALFGPGGRGGDGSTGGDGGHSRFGNGGNGGDSEGNTATGGRGGDGYNGGNGGYGDPGGRGGDGSTGVAQFYLYTRGDLNFSGTIIASGGDGGDGGDGNNNVSGAGGDGGNAGDGSDVTMLCDGDLTNTGTVNNSGGTGGTGGGSGGGGAGSDGSDGEDGETVIAKVVVG